MDKNRDQFDPDMFVARCLLVFAFVAVLVSFLER